MSTIYTPTAVALTTIVLPDDGDARVAASVNDPLERLADAILAASNGGLIPNYVDFTSNGTFVLPSGSPNFAIIYGCGGGGGGGPGKGRSGSFPGNNEHGSGGGGGGGAVAKCGIYALAGAGTYSVVCGAGGAAGTPAVPTDGGDGGDSTVKLSTTLIATFSGAQGGLTGETASTVGAQAYTWGLGGAPVRASNTVRTRARTFLQDSGVTVGWYDSSFTLTAPHEYRFDTIPQHGTSGVTSNASAMRSSHSPEGYAGAVGGGNGAADGSYWGGGGGGAGGAGPFGDSGAGGAGGDGNASTAGDAGLNGGGGGGYGSGGGGGGAVGSGTTFVAGHDGGDGGGGAPGRVIVIYFTTAA